MDRRDRLSARDGVGGRRVLHRGRKIDDGDGLLPVGAIACGVGDDPRNLHGAEAGRGELDLPRALAAGEDAAQDGPFVSGLGLRGNCGCGGGVHRDDIPYREHCRDFP